MDDEVPPHEQYKDAGFFPEAGRATPRPFSDLLKETGYNVEEDKPLLECSESFYALRVFCTACALAWLHSLILANTP